MNKYYIIAVDEDRVVDCTYVPPLDGLDTATAVKRFQAEMANSKPYLDAINTVFKQDIQPSQVKLVQVIA